MTISSHKKENPMKFKKLVLCVLVGILAINFSNIEAFAAENTTAKTESSTEVKKEVKETPKYNAYQLRLLSALIYCESGSES
jgi:hypothetical protein